MLAIATRSISNFMLYHVIAELKGSPCKESHFLASFQLREGQNESIKEVASCD